MCVNSARWLLLERLFPVLSLCFECLRRGKKEKKNFFIELKAIDNTQQAVISSAEHTAAQLLDLWYHGKALEVDLQDFSASSEGLLRFK